MTRHLNLFRGACWAEGDEGNLCLWRGLVFDVYFIYKLHTHLQVTYNSIICKTYSELAPHSTDIQPARRTPHRLSHYTQPFPESLAGYWKIPPARTRLSPQRSAFIVQSSVVRSLRPCWTNFSSSLLPETRSAERYDGLITASPSGFPCSMNTRRPSTRNRPSAKSWTARG